MTHNIHNGKSTAYYTSSLETLQTSTNSKLDTIDGVLDNILVDTSAIKVDAAALEVLQTSTNTKLDTLETTLTTIESAVGTSGSSGPSKVISIGGIQSGGNIKQLLVDSDGHLQVDILSGGGSNASVKVDNAVFNTTSDSVTMIGGFAGTQSVGSNDAAALACDTSGHLHVRNTTEEGKLDTLETTLTAIETDAAALEVLQTSTNSKLDTLETTLTAIETDAAALEVLQTSTNTKLDTLETTLTAIETDAAALEVLQTSTNSKLDTIDGVLDNILVDTSAIKVDIAAIEVLNTAIKNNFMNSDSTTTLRNNASVSAGDISSAIDLGSSGSQYRNITIYGSTTTLAAKFYIQFGPTSTVADHYLVDATESILKLKVGTSVYHYVMSLRDVPERYVSVICDVAGSNVYQYAVPTS